MHRGACMSVIQLTAESENSGKERRPLVAMPTARAGQVSASLIIQSLNEGAKLGHVVPALPDMADESMTVECCCSTVSAA